jgi:Leucine-rich repeat (LRR) protein
VLQKFETPTVMAAKPLSELQQASRHSIFSPMIFHSGGVFVRNGLLDSLDLSGNGLFQQDAPVALPDTIHALCRAIMGSSILRSLDLRGNALDCEGVATLSEAVRESVSLDQIAFEDGDVPERPAYLSVRQFRGKVGALIRYDEKKLTALSGVAIAKLLQGNITLTELSLAGNELEDTGVCAISNTIKGGGVASLKRLNLGRNSATGEAATAVASMLAANLESLTFVDMSGNTSFSSATLAAGLQSNSHLTDLHLQKTQLTDADMRTLGDVLLRPDRDI